ncbi:hypothetical protein BASA82_000144 [Batrachochytrium salamandrivorans]|nr:hypothetical protein BASA81_001636 [Batrachochytrium salamandrivorans]KAH9262852.1 hypothetical protein BASA82_000144 [Batrachochytrium salamandrivorans]
MASQNYTLLTNDAAFVAPIASNVIAGALGLQAPYSVESIRFNPQDIESFSPRIKASMDKGVRRVYIVDQRGFNANFSECVQAMCREKEMDFAVLQNLPNVQEVAKTFGVNLT